jgi:hypothetical protein
VRAALSRLRGHTARAVANTLVCSCISGPVLVAPAWAYRPFDGTDAAVAEKDKLEIELQPAGPFKDALGTTLIAPGTRFNYGLTETWEAVLEGQLEHPLSGLGPPNLTAAGAFLKGVLREGSLQDKTGPSIATEFGLLLPDSHGEGRLGASLAGVVSQRWDWGAVHLNGAIELTRERHADLFIGAILEGPAKWSVRPVAEVFYERDFGNTGTVSGLVGLIWQVHEDLAFDVAVRHAVTNGRALNEVRAGVSFSLPFSRPSPTRSR